MRGLNDLDGEPLMPVNYSCCARHDQRDQEQAQQRSLLGCRKRRIAVQEYKHYSPEKMEVLPYDEC
jgi:hypothetical protein